MKNLAELFAADRSVRDSSLPEEAWRAIMGGAAETFKASSLLEQPSYIGGGQAGAFPVEYLDYGPGALQSRAIKLVDMAQAQFGMKGSGGQFDRVDYALDDQPFLPFWANFEVPEREQAASVFGTAGLDLLRDSGRNSARLVVEKVNEALVGSAAFPIKGVTLVAGQTFAGSSWATQGNAYKDVLTAIRKLMQKKAPVGSAAALVNPQELMNVFQTFGSTSDAQIEKLRALLPGGLYWDNNVTAGKAYIYAKVPDVVRVRVAQRLTGLPLPKVDLGERGMTRTILTTHFLRTDGIVELTGLT